jgi:hypothetical protein
VDDSNLRAPQSGERVRPPLDAALASRMATGEAKPARATCSTKECHRDHHHIASLRGSAFRVAFAGEATQLARPARAAVARREFGSSPTRTPPRAAPRARVDDQPS